MSTIQIEYTNEISQTNRIPIQISINTNSPITTFIFFFTQEKFFRFRSKLRSFRNDSQSHLST